MQPYARFLRVWFAALLVLALCVAALNFAIDPYDVFGSPRVAGVNALKPRARDHSMLTKAYQIERFRPATVLLGSSRVHIGVDASGPEWPAAMQPVFNYAIPGSYNTTLMLATLQQAAATGRLAHAVIFLDFQNFFVPEAPPGPPNEDDRRLLLDPSGNANALRGYQRLDDGFLALMTMGALSDSVATILSQHAALTLDIQPDGASTDADFVSTARGDGTSSLFAQKRVFEANRTPVLARGLAAWTGPLPNLGRVVDVIAFCRRRGIALTLAIAPTHAEALEFYWRAGLWPRIEQFKTELAELVARDGAEGVKLWDFSDYSSFTTEPVPPVSDRKTQTTWFWEPSHFKKPRGHIMIRRITGQAAPEFGALLTPETVAERNRQIRAQRQAYICLDTANPCKS